LGSFNPVTIPDTMTVPRFVGGGKIDFIEKPVPEPGPGELLVAVRANALCGSERGQFYNGSPNVTPGHEAAGLVIFKAGAGPPVPARAAIGSFETGRRVACAD
jgi:threonine dehydrogenase-like Zn-dependent dehydrogenase